MLARAQGILVVISIVFITIFIIILVEKDTLESTDTLLLNKCVTSGKFGPVFSGQYCLLVGAGETEAFFFSFLVVTVAREHH